MRAFHFTHYIPPQQNQRGFQQLLDLFLQLLVYTSGDAGEALSWLNELDRQYNLTDDKYGMGDFIEDLKKNGYISPDPSTNDGFSITAKSE